MTGCYEVPPYAIFKLLVTLKHSRNTLITTGTTYGDAAHLATIGTAQTIETRGGLKSLKHSCFIGFGTRLWVLHHKINEELKQRMTKRHDVISLHPTQQDSFGKYLYQIARNDTLIEYQHYGRRLELRSTHIKDLSCLDSAACGSDVRDSR
ncbi:hypothetical protein EVAR_84897_1 [Eumeta japonica]|uniref:Uncharacterized protein n=1 Tax=Eumeta variegata TaxID=151549 RepID=A0A4C1YDT3_EUMVA|nr:hypothetical protein EVAR_84897_1 [Eumeta japonica]